MEISNRSLAVLLILSIVVSVGGAVINLARLTELSSILPFSKGVTGYGVTGIVNVSLHATENLNVTQTFVDFGVGYVTAPTSGALLITDDTQANWTDVPDLSFNPEPLALENTGNVNLSVSIVSNKNAITYLGGGTSPSLKFNSSHKEPNACTGSLQGAFTEIAASGGAYNNTKNLCSLLQFITGANELYVDLSLYIPYDSPVGNKSSILTFNASQA